VPLQPRSVHPEASPAANDSAAGGDSALPPGPVRRGRPPGSRPRAVPRLTAAAAARFRRGHGAAIHPGRRFPALTFVASPWSRPDDAGDYHGEDELIDLEEENDPISRDLEDRLSEDAVARPPFPHDGARGPGRAARPTGGAADLPPHAGGCDALAPGGAFSPGAPAPAAPAPGYNPFAPPLPPRPTGPLDPRLVRVPRGAPPNPQLDPLVVSLLGLLRASQTDAALDFAYITQPTAQELLSVQPAAARVLFCAPRVPRVSTPAEEAERAKADKARKTNTNSPWHTHSADQLQLFAFTAWQVIFHEMPNTALLGFQVGLAANWHVSDPEKFANQGPFLVNRQDGALLFTTMESAVAACNRAQPPGSLYPALVAQIRSNIIPFFRLRAETILPWCHPSAGSLITRTLPSSLRPLCHSTLGSAGPSTTPKRPSQSSAPAATETRTRRSSPSHGPSTRPTSAMAWSTALPPSQSSRPGLSPSSHPPSSPSSHPPPAATRPQLGLPSSAVPPHPHYIFIFFREIAIFSEPFLLGFRV
jgi:hypothetical protein